MAKDKKLKKPVQRTSPKTSATDSRLFSLVGTFLRDARLSSTVKIFEAETATKIKAARKSLSVAPANLEEALEAWEKAQKDEVKAEDSGSEGDDESSDSEGNDTPDSSDDEGGGDMKDDSSVTVSGDNDKKEEKDKERYVDCMAKPT
jgi:hypothetical protein